MANKRISALDALTGANVASDSDVLVIVDTSTGKAKKITVAQLGVALGVGSAAASAANTVTVDAADVTAGYVDITFATARADANYYPFAIMVLADDQPSAAEVVYSTRATTGFRVRVYDTGTLIWGVIPYE